MNMDRKLFIEHYAKDFCSWWVCNWRNDNLVAKFVDKDDAEAFIKAVCGKDKLVFIAPEE